MVYPLHCKLAEKNELPESWSIIYSCYCICWKSCYRCQWYCILHFISLSSQNWNPTSIKTKWWNSSFVEKQIPVLKCFDDRWNITDRKRNLWTFISSVKLSYLAKFITIRWGFFVSCEIFNNFHLFIKKLCSWNQVRGHIGHLMDLVGKLLTAWAD